MKIVSNGKTLEVPGGGQAQEIYSTEETRIGTWIDGKPMYRKVLAGVTGNAGTWKSIGTIHSAELISGNGYINAGGSAQRLLAPNMSSHISMNGDGSIMVYVLVDTMENKPVCVICTYTKSTDQAEGTAT